MIGFIIFIFAQNLYDYLTELHKSEAESARYLAKEIKGILISKHIDRGFHIKLDVNGEIKKDYLRGSKNYNYAPSSLYDFLQKNDSLVKPANSLDLYVYRDHVKYRFRIGERINK
jgi:hypothetical protein